MKNAIVTGYSGGIGEAIALELEKNGFNIIKLNSRLEDINSLEKEIKDKLFKLGIKIDWPYQPLMHLQPVFKKLYGEMEGQLKKSEEIAMRHFCLPIHLGIEEKDAIYIAQKVIEIIS